MRIKNCDGSIQICRCLRHLVWTFGLHVLAVAPSGIAQDATATKTPSLGVVRTIEQIVLPGSELTHRTVDPATTPLVVRVVDSFPHGDSFRYDISYFGMTKGEFDLRDYLIRKDGSSIEGLPPIPVKIESILGEGQIEPNELEVGQLSRFGGYWKIVTFGIVAWGLILCVLIFAGRKRKAELMENTERKKTLAELLQPSIERAIDGTLPKEKYAELERFLFSFWQKRLKLEHLQPADALNRIRENEESGPLVQQLEAWLHARNPSHDDVDIAKLLSPYQEISSTDLETSGLQASGLDSGVAKGVSGQ